MPCVQESRRKIDCVKFILRTSKTTNTMLMLKK